MWGTAKLDRLDPLDKIDAALEIFEKTPLERGRQPAQGAALLVLVRHALAHAKPATDSGRPETTTQEVRRLSGRLRAARVVPCRFVGTGNAMFPWGLLGAGGAEWAFTTGIRCADEFYRRLGIPPRYENLRPQLVVGSGKT
jgi:hypothetical protein